MKSPCPLMSAETDRGIHLFIPRHSPITAHPPCGERSRGGSVVSGSVVSACIIPKPSLCPKLGAISGGGGASSASKGNAETRNPFAECRNLGFSRNSECFCGKGELGAPLSSLVPLNSSLSSFSPFLGTRSLFRVRGN